MFRPLFHFENVGNVGNLKTAYVGSNAHSNVISCFQKLLNCCDNKNLESINVNTISYLVQMHAFELVSATGLGNIERNIW